MFTTVYDSEADDECAFRGYRNEANQKGYAYCFGGFDQLTAARTRIGVEAWLVRLGLPFRLPLSQGNCLVGVE